LLRALRGPADWGLDSVKAKRGSLQMVATPPQAPDRLQCGCRRQGQV